MSNQSEETKVAVMQERVKNLETSVTKIMDNHLPHIQKELEKVNTGLTELRVMTAKYVGGGVAAMGIIQIIIQLLR